VTPLELFAVICVFAIARIALTVRPRSTGRALAVATAGGEPGVGAAPESARTVIIEYLDAFIVAGLVALFLISFVVRTFYIPSGSMEPTLQIHDVLLVNEFEYRVSKPHDEDIAVFPPPLNQPNDFIKRVIAQPGDRLRIHNQVVYRNGIALNEPYIKESPTYELEIKNYGIYVDGQPLDPVEANIPPKSAWAAPDRVPDTCYFMMGDNRMNSEDSHVWGFAQTTGTFFSGERKGQKASFTGHAFFLFWPPDRIRILH